MPQLDRCLLSINNYYYARGGADVVFLEHNRLLEQVGWQTVPFSMRHPDNLQTSWSGYFPDEIEYGRSYGLGEQLVRALRVIYSHEARRKLRELLGQVRPSIAHVHNVYHHLSPSILPLLKSLNIPIVLTIHDLKLACPARTMTIGNEPCERCNGGRYHNVTLNRCIKGSLALSSLVMIEAYVQRLLGLYQSNVARFVVPSRFMLEQLVNWGWSRERFVYIPNFVDVDRFSPHGSIGQRFAYCGRLDNEKGCTTLLRAAAMAGQKVTFIGSGPAETELRNLAASLGAEVEFAGRQQGEALRSLIGTARAVVVPSEINENAPLAILEAYAAGRPVIGARRGGIPELVREGQTGTLFPSGDAGALAAALRSFAEMSDARLGEMGAAGRRWVEEEFSATTYRNRMLDLYASLVSAESPNEYGRSSVELS
jgi:glycosyltransferase involved in cell wall biosynthesis